MSSSLEDTTVEPAEPGLEKKDQPACLQQGAPGPCRRGQDRHHAQCPNSRGTARAFMKAMKESSLPTIGRKRPAQWLSGRSHRKRLATDCPSCRAFWGMPLSRCAGKEACALRRWALILMLSDPGRKSRRSECPSRSARERPARRNMPNVEPANLLVAPFCR